MSSGSCPAPRLPPRGAHLCAVRFLANSLSGQQSPPLFVGFSRSPRGSVFGPTRTSFGLLRRQKLRRGQRWMALNPLRAPVRCCPVLQLAGACLYLAEANKAVYPTRRPRIDPGASTQSVQEARRLRRREVVSRFLHELQVVAAAESTSPWLAGSVTLRCTQAACTAADRFGLLTRRTVLAVPLRGIRVSIFSFQ